MKKFVFFACLIYALNGFGHIIIGTVLEPMVKSYGIHYGDGGQLIMNQFLGFLVGVSFAPMIVNAIGRKLTISLALLCFTIAQFVLGSSPKWDILLFIAPIGGAGIGIAETVVAALIVGHLKEKKASTLVLTEVFFGVGALVIPMISAFFILNGMWNASFTTVAIITSMTLLGWFFLSFGEMDPILKKRVKVRTQNKEKISRNRYPRKQIPLLVIGAFFFFMYVGTEMVLPNYLPTILSKTTSLDASSLALSITVFWLAMTVGRLCMTFIIDKIGYVKLFIISCIGQFFALIIFAVSPSVIISYVAIFLTGLLMGGIFSIGLLIINENSVGLEEWTTSLLVAMGGLGGAFLPKIAGELIDRYPISATLWALVLFGFILVVLMGAIFYYRKDSSKASEKVMA
ncbi:sugar MFS transporter [Lederbergia wuyishanensis]|uniref:FHS family glucose/mannose:H+ symporter-like MFS transporter n=1 Tax=Lederbergia wuyishanensis TaxID=1347903 RepID=A0ABU0DAZ1_9BACI|nr:MFS transporter [Lederbergia wuyishanensis]MCJ8010077.1 MFS transporter [Lederbergia wuyishanensis]MDQ0345591.1 FHS family glucose/mannose:H+ symporter-like MFS transporter [Lederbergia wuyishanensis]